jgi:hypothetical protein
MNSEWVKTEIAKARRREVHESRQVLFPIRLAEFPQLRDWECFDADIGKDSGREIREYFIPDFSQWRNSEFYQAALAGLLRDLAIAMPPMAGVGVEDVLALDFELHSNATFESTMRALRQQEEEQKRKLSQMKLYKEVDLSELEELCEYARARTNVGQTDGLTDVQRSWKEIYVTLQAECVARRAKVGNPIE